MLAQKTQILGLKEFRANITTLWKKAQKTKTKYIILHHASPIMEINPILEKEFILEKLAADVKKARAQIKQGKVYTHDEICKKLGL